MNDLQAQNEGKVRTLIFSEGKTLLTAFLAGTAIILWLLNSVIGPQRESDTKIKLIQSDIVNLRDNHIHTLDERTKVIEEEQKKQALQLEKITTILEERLPVK